MIAELIAETLKCLGYSYPKVEYGKNNFRGYAHYQEYDLNQMIGSIRATYYNKRTGRWNNVIFEIIDDTVYAYLHGYGEEPSICVSRPDVDLEKWVSDIRLGNLEYEKLEPII